MKKFYALAVALAVSLIFSTSWSAEKKPIRIFDNPPEEPMVVKPNIPVEYESLIKTFDEYWGALIKNDYEKSYNLESTDYRNTTGLDAYKGSFGKDIQLLHVRALDVQKISEKEVMVTGSMILKIPPISLRQAHFKPLKDKWIKEGKAWRHVRETKKS